MFSIGFWKLSPSCPTEQLEEEYFVSKKFLDLFFSDFERTIGPLWKIFSAGVSILRSTYPLGQFQESVFLKEKTFLSACFGYLEKCFWQSGIKNCAVFITAFWVCIRILWWRQFQWKKSYRFHISWILNSFFFGFLAFCFQQVCWNCILNIHWNTSSSFLYS